MAMNGVGLRVCVFMGAVIVTALAGNKLSSSPVAVALCNLQTGTATGRIVFTQMRDRPTKITGFVANVTPGLHGWHVHESAFTNGDCGEADGHFNPDGVPHGDRLAEVRHVGDLGNFFAQANGIAQILLEDDIVSITGPSDRSIVGRSIVIHGGQDDLGLGGDAGSVSAGNSGPRVGCCIIERVL